MIDKKDLDEKDHKVVVSAYEDQPTLKRNISAIAIVGLALSQWWAARPSTIVLGLTQGGTLVVLYGLLGTSLINVFIASTLAELSASWPTAGGQYVWSSILAKPKWRRSISFTVGWVTIMEWITTTASVVMISAEVATALAELFHPNYEPQRWHTFLMFLAVNSISTLNNLFVLSRLPSIGTMFFIVSSAIYLTILIVCPAMADTHQSNKFVWATYMNETDWKSSFVVVMMGLVNPSYVFAGIDGAVHIAEDCLDPARSVPYSLFATVGMGLFTGLTFSIALLYSIQDVAAAAVAELPFLTIIVQATGSKVCGTVMMVAFMVVLMISSNSVHQATSRLIWSFARDKGMPCGDRVAHVHPTLSVPVIPILMSWFGVTVLGVLFVASPTVYGSIIATCILLGNFSYAILSLQLLANGRKMNPDRWLKLGWFGYVSQVVVILWTVLTTVMWLFPGTPSPSPSEANYTPAVLGAMGLIAVVDWFVYGKKHFVGPDDTPLSHEARHNSESAHY